MNKKYLIVAFILMLNTQIAFGGSPSTLTKIEKTCGEYFIKICEYDEEGIPLVLDRLEIYKNNELIYKDENKQFRIGLMYDEMPEGALINGCQDITGDGQLNLVIANYSGGAHCCFGFMIFQLGENFKLLDTVNAGDSDLARFEDLDGDGKLEFIGNDWTFAYWNETFFGSPEPRIVLKYRGGKYLLALDLMKKPLPSPREEEKIFKNIQSDIRKIEQSSKMQIKKDLPFGEPDVGKDTGYFAWVKGDVILPGSVWGYMLDLIYTGHPSEAWRFLDKVWPEGKSGKEKFIADFKEQLSLSPYWDSIKINIEKE
ncbi:MAG: VCBS repeat-containing protein [Candidatus Gygaella obscura]|nr:VCBS repeat-containing protein [Candidatus Gygaella obscura]